ncbi:MAG: hypothetical protein B655_1653 [Methanobacterium sp. Maddingley MBC34]|nr:MAG: hypothetical protein B655_1653 [Methanobacterium sp. Maddingley MBC34]
MLAVIGIYLILGFFLFNYFLYIAGVDGICYLSIAQKYASGDMLNAINGYWSPLFSWLIVPFILKGYTPLSTLIASKILSLIIGLFTILGLYCLSCRFKINKTVKTVFIFSLIIPTLWFAYTELTPDLLMSCALIYCLVFLIDPDYPYKYSNGLMCGFTGALAYLSKSFAFPFFLALFVLFSILYYFKKFKDDKRVVKNLILGLTIFFLISGSWALILSEKYGELTIGTSGEYNYNALGPDVQLHHPMFLFSVVKPPNPSAVSGWEDPSYVKLRSWSPFESWSSFQYQLKIIGENILRMAIIMFWFSPIMLPVLLLGIIAYLKSSDKTFKWGLMSLLITIFVFIVGYLPLVVLIRYFFFVYFLSFFLGSYILSEFITRHGIDSIRKKLLLSIFFFLFIVSPFFLLTQDSGSYNGIYEASEFLKTDFHVQGSIASDSKFFDFPSLYLAYFLNSAYYGSVDANNNSLQLELEKNSIGYYFVWDKTKNINLSDYNEINREMTYNNSFIPRVFKRTI